MSSTPASVAALRTIRRSALYDLIVTLPFATPWTARWLFAGLGALHEALGLPGPRPVLVDAIPVLFANLMGSLVVVWSITRLHAPTLSHGVADTAARGAFALWMAWGAGVGRVAGDRRLSGRRGRVGPSCRAARSTARATLRHDDRRARHRGRSPDLDAAVLRAPRLAAAVGAQRVGLSPVHRRRRRARPVPAARPDARLRARRARPACSGCRRSARCGRRDLAAVGATKLAELDQRIADLQRMRRAIAGLLAQPCIDLEAPCPIIASARRAPGAPRIIAAMTPAAAWGRGCARCAALGDGPAVLSTPGPGDVQGRRFGSARDSGRAQARSAVRTRK